MVEEEEHPFVLVIVHCKVLVPDCPVGSVSVEVGEEGVVTDIPFDPPTKLQAPVSPVPGELADKLTVPGQVAEILEPAVAVLDDKVVYTTS